MVNGNVNKFPESITESESLSCQNVVTGDNSVTVSGSMLLQQEHDCPIHKDFSLTFSARDYHGL